MTNTLIDNAILSELSEAMGADFAGELIETFLSDAPNMFSALEKAVADSDADGYRRAAHSIKSNAQVFGATVLCDQARDMELAQLSAESAASVMTLQATYDQTAAALRSFLDD